MGRWTGLMGVRAECETCGWTSEHRNALANAKRHYNATGHTVHIEEYIGITYAREDSEWAQHHAKLRAEGGTRK